MCQPGILHDVCDAGAAITAATNRARGGLDNTLMCDVFPISGGFRGSFLHDDHHITFQSEMQGALMEMSELGCQAACSSAMAVRKNRVTFRYSGTLPPGAATGEGICDLKPTSTAGRRYPPSRRAMMPW